MAKDPEVVEEIVESNEYTDLLSSELREEYDEKKVAYKAARKSARNVGERRVIMEAYQADLMDLAAEAQISGDYQLTRELDAFIKSLGGNQFHALQQFFITMPKLSHEVKFKNPKTKKNNKVTLEGLQSFFG